MMIVNLIDFIPKKLDHRNVFVKKDGDYLIVSCNKIRPPRPVKLRKRIKIDEFFLEVIGLYFGDGGNSLNGSGNRKVCLANTNFILHKNWIKFLEQLGIEKNLLYAQIQKGFNTHLSDLDFFNYWLNKTNIPLNRFCKVISIKNFKCKKYGLLVVNYNNKLFRNIFNNLFKFSLGLCKDDKKLSAAFLRGLFAAEGYVKLNRYKSLNILDIPIINSKRRTFVNNLFKKLEIKTVDAYNRLKIMGYLNFKRCNELNLVSIHPKKKIKFKQGFKHLINYGQVPALTKIRIIELLKRHKEMTRFQISKLLNIGVSCAYKSLKDLEIKDIVVCSGKSLSMNNRYLRNIWVLKQEPNNLFDLMSRDYS